MIREITGDLIKSAKQYNVLLHGCNCHCTMGAGIAAQIRDKFPEAYIVDKQTAYGSHDKLGTISYTKKTTPIIVNAYTQFRYGHEKVHADYDAIRSCMQEVKKLFSGKKIGMPRVGCGLAGGSWEVVSKIIEEELGSEDVTIVVWEQEGKW